MLKKGFEKAYDKYLKNIKEFPARDLSGKVKPKSERIEIQNPYHHNFKLNNSYLKKRSAEKTFFELFDLARILGLVFIVVKIGMKMPSYVFFRRTKFENNPDFMLCDQAYFEQLDK
jgi:hypothetical protein